jgi:hypothetical protein
VSETALDPDTGITALPQSMGEMHRGGKVECHMILDDSFSFTVDPTDSHVFISHAWL